MCGLLGLTICFADLDEALMSRTIANLLDFALGLALVLDTDGTAACGGVGSHVNVFVGNVFGLLVMYKKIQ
jgi:hypothetical protein